MLSCLRNFTGLNHTESPYLLQTAGCVWPWSPDRDWAWGVCLPAHKPHTETSTKSGGQEPQTSSADSGRVWPRSLNSPPSLSCCWSRTRWPGRTWHRPGPARRTRSFSPPVPLRLWTRWARRLRPGRLRLPRLAAACSVVSSSS